MPLTLEAGQQAVPLTTRLFIPLSRADLVSRPRLFDRLNEGMTRELTLLAAPAGFGKTTLLSAWATERRRMGGAVAWLTLDQGDNDTVRFFAHLIDAIHSVYNGLALAALELLRSPQPVPDPELLTVFLHALARVPGELVLILDDYHGVVNPAIHPQIGTILDSMPRQMHLFIATRSDPPLPLARLRARGALLEIGAEQLRFTRAEAQMFFRDTMRLKLEPSDVAVLEGRTEGWVTGMQLAALAVRDRPDPRPLIARFAGSQRYVLDYLTEEVLQQQPPELLKFMLETSMLQRLSGPLCEAVTGGTGGQQMLERLERAHLFLVPLDDDRHWYRYYHLFGQALKTRLAAGSPGRETELHRRAAAWYSGLEQTSEAIPHLLAAQDWAQAADLIEGATDRTLIAGELKTVADWIDALPERCTATRPMLCVARAHILLLEGRAEDAAQRLEDAERQLAGAGPAAAPRAAGRIAALRTLLAAGMRLDVPQAIAQGEAALKLLAADETNLRATVLWGMGLAHELRGDVRMASQVLEESVHLAARAHNRSLEIEAGGTLVEALQLQGKLRAARQAGQRALVLADDGAGGILAMAAQNRLHMVTLLCELDELAAAQSHIDAALEAAIAEGNERTQIAVWIYQAKILWVQRRFDAALETLRRAEDLCVDAEIQFTRSRIQTLQVRVLTSLGHTFEAQRWEAERGPAGGPDLAMTSQRPLLMHEGEEIMIIRLRLLEGRLEDALVLIGQWLPNAREGHRWSRVIELKLLEALVCQAQGALNPARAALQEALRLGEPEGFVRCYLQEGPLLVRLLDLEALEGPQSRYAKHLLARAVRDLDSTGGQGPGSDAGLAVIRAAVATTSEPGAGSAPARAGSSAGQPSGAAAVSAAPAAPPPDPVATFSGAAGSGPTSPNDLSVRELEILQCIADGMSNQDIGEEIDISVATVKWHITNILGKLRAKNRTEAVARARKNGHLAR